MLSGSWSLNCISSRLMAAQISRSALYGSSGSAQVPSSYWHPNTSDVRGLQGAWALGPPGSAALPAPSRPLPGTFGGPLLGGFTLSRPAQSEAARSDFFNNTGILLRKDKRSAQAGAHDDAISHVSGSDDFELDSNMSDISYDSDESHSTRKPAEDAYQQSMAQHRAPLSYAKAAAGEGKGTTSQSRQEQAQPAKAQPKGLKEVASPGMPEWMLRRSSLRCLSIELIARTSTRAARTRQDRGARPSC